MSKAQCCLNGSKCEWSIQACLIWIQGNCCPEILWTNVPWLWMVEKDPKLSKNDRLLAMTMMPWKMTGTQDTILVMITVGSKYRIGSVFKWFLTKYSGDLNSGLLCRVFKWSLNGGLSVSNIQMVLSEQLSSGLIGVWMDSQWSSIQVVTKITTKQTLSGNGNNNDYPTDSQWSVNDNKNNNDNDNDVR